MKNLPEVLIADDDANIRKLIVTVVKSTIPSAIITAVDDGKKALDHYQSHGASLHISNFMMPEMDGLTLVATLRSTNPALPIIMVSGAPEARQLGKDVGIDRFVDKFELTKCLPSVIHSLLGSTDV